MFALVNFSQYGRRFQQMEMVMMMKRTELYFIPLNAHLDTVMSMNKVTVLQSFTVY